MNKQEKINKLEELKKKAYDLKIEIEYYNALQLALKLVLNGAYGAFATNYFILFNNYVAGTITAEGRNLTKTMSDVNEYYWYNLWHIETWLHEKLKIKNVKQIPTTKPASIYGDTDSCHKDTLIRTDKGILTIEDFYNLNIKNGSAGETKNGHESVSTAEKVLNWNNDLYYADVRRIIRHEVSKPKWKLKTKSGKEIIITGDHSMVVFRNGEQKIFKPSEILKSDKILSLKEVSEYIFEEIEFCEQIGDFENEYVYDIEMDDDTHTFIANDILIHNSIFVGFEPAIESCDWKNLIFNKDYLNKETKKFSIISKTPLNIKINNNNYLSEIIVSDKVFESDESIRSSFNSEVLYIDGSLIKNWDFNKILKDYKGEVFYNWNNELDFIHGIDKFRYADYFKTCLDNHASAYGIENKQDFELERVSESIINIAKKKYIQHIVYEDGIPYDRLTYIFPKGVELVRSSTPLFARDKIVGIVKYLFEHPDNFNIKELLKLVKNLKKEFDLCVPDRIDEISMQSSCSNYNEKCLNDKEKLDFVSGAHFAVKASGYYNYLLHRNSNLHEKYEFIKSGSKIKYYYVKDKSINDIFAYLRGAYPIEMAPEIDLETQFEKCILSPINSIIEPLGLPLITKRLSVVMDIFGGNGF